MKKLTVTITDHVFVNSEKIYFEGNYWLDVGTENSLSPLIKLL